MNIHDFCRVGLSLVRRKLFVRQNEGGRRFVTRGESWRTRQRQGSSVWSGTARLFGTWGATGSCLTAQSRLLGTSSYLCQAQKRLLGTSSSSCSLCPAQTRLLGTSDRCSLCPCPAKIRSLSSTSGQKNLNESGQTSQQPQSETTIDEEEVRKFNGLSSLWWDEAGEFEPLHSLNELRVPLVRDALVSIKKLDEYNVRKPLEGFLILDVGSGGGILSEPLARLGASVVGLEASEESIKIAQAHLIHDPSIHDKVQYIHCTVEELAETQTGKFDAVVASEVLEHVSDAKMFVSCACKLVKPGGSIFFTTLNKTRLAYLLGIIVAENVLKIVPSGTHDWQKFVPPRDLQHLLEKNNFTTRIVHGMSYNVLNKRWTWTNDTSINYALHAVAPSVADTPDRQV